MNRNKLIDVIQATPATNFVRLLHTLGFNEVGRGGTDDRRVHLRRDSDELIVPMRQELRDYGRSIVEILRLVRPKGLKIVDLVTMASLPPSDMYRHHFEDEETKTGAFPLAELPDAAAALFDLFRFTAAGVLSARRSYTRIPDDAAVFANKCKVGQTELGSFIVKIFCPLEIESKSVVVDQLEPFGRQVVHACLENFEFLGEDDALLPDKSPPATLNRNVLTAVSRLRPMVFTPKAEASAWFNRWAAPVLDAGMERPVILISEATFTHAALLQRRYEPREGNDLVLLSGYVVDLHKDRPSKSATLTHTVTMEVKEGGAWRKLRMSLLPSQYRQAVLWHDRNARVDVTALVDKDRVPWRVLEIHAFDAREAAQQDLFAEENER